MIARLILIVIAVLGAPLFIIIATAAIFGFVQEEVDLAVIPIEIYRLAETPVLIAIPLFTFAGYLLGESKAPSRLVNLTNALLGWLPGGLAIMALVTCAIFTAFTGASGVTIVALGALLYPALKEAGYSERFNLGLITSSGSLGVLFAPSLPLILYGVVVQQLGPEQPVGIAFHDKLVYVVDRSASKVEIFSKDGEYIDSFGSKGSGRKRFKDPTGICLHDDVIYVSDFGEDMNVASTSHDIRQPRLAHG